ncbi:MAG TPA: DoxX family membrane protein [Candidatus Angelobacter sp.]|nr:DoxX family membrane protein [Candidatus Angelobacter sp.]
MAAKGGGSSSVAMAVARIIIGIMFLFFAQYKIFGHDFAHGGYERYVTGWLDSTAVGFYKPFLRVTLHFPVASAYAVAAAELLIGLSMVLGFLVRPFAIVGALFMLNLLLCTWVLPPGSELWKYFGHEIDNICMFLLFVLFFAHNAGQTAGLDK